MAKYISKVLVTEGEIREICRRIGKAITEDYQGKEILLIGVLRGAVVFMSDLMRTIDIPCEIDFMSVSSYSGTKSSGVVKIVKDLDCDIEGRDVIIVEDIVDSGLTLSHLKELLETRNPKSVRIATCFDKPDRRRADVHVDYIGKKIPDEFIVGYGLDYEGRYRNLPEVCVLADDGMEE